MSYILTELAYLYDGYKPWIVPFVQFLGLLLFTFVLNRSYQKLVIFLSERMQVLDLLAKAFYLPLIALIYFSFFWNFVPHLVQYAHWSFSDVAMDGVYKVVMLAIFIWFVGRFAGMVKDYLLLSDFMKEKLNQRMVYFTFELVYWTLILVFILGSLHILDIKISDTLHMLGQGIIIWSFTLIFLYTLHVGFKENIKVFSEKGHFFAATILNALFLPILLMVLSIGLAFTFRETKLGSYLPIKLHLRDLLVPIFFWAVYRATSLLEKEFLSGRLTRRYPDKTRVQTIGKFSRMFTLLIALFLIMLSDRLNYASQIAKWIGGGLLS